MTRLIGKSPVPLPVLIVGKLAFLGSLLFCAFKWTHPEAMLFDSPWTRAIGIVLFVGGFAMVVVGTGHLGRSVAVGLPEEATELKTHGLYRFTRNPMYLGGFIMCAGSCLYSVHIVNVLMTAVAVTIHVAIVKREEAFLARRFGQQWTAYQQRVPRFIRWLPRFRQHRNAV
jgi:protein-S-isoprenylcysteine O-methyltransferase Ste14